MVSAPQAVDATTAMAAASVEFFRRQTAATVTVIVTGYDGWAKGQAISITNAAYRWVAQPFVISSVNMVVLSGTGMRQYTLTCGTDPISFRRRVVAGYGQNKPIAAPRISGTIGGVMPPS